jgi:phosphoribosyl 1,2-cyclic phosphate phosphodiesterase
VRWTDDGGKERVVLLDATPDLREQALRHDIRRCDAILFTHNHVDHIFGLDEVRRFCVVMGKELGIGPIPLDIFAEQHTMDALRRVYKHIFDSQSNINRSFVASVIPRLMEPHDPIDLHGMRFTPIRMMHGKLPIVGFRIERIDAKHEAGSPLPLAYCTDVSGIPPETWAYLEGLETLVLDGLRLRNHPTHFNIEQASGVAQRVGAPQTWLVHLAHEIVHAEVDPTLPEGVNLAYDGLTLGSRVSLGSG